MQYAAATAEDLDTEIDVWHLPGDITAPPASGSSGAGAQVTDGQLQPADGRSPLAKAPERAAAEPAPVSARVSGPAERLTEAATIVFRPIAEEVSELEKKRMMQALAATGGRRNKAAELISMPLRTFVTKLKRYGIQKSSK